MIYRRVHANRGAFNPLRGRADRTGTSLAADRALRQSNNINQTYSRNDSAAGIVTAGKPT